LAAEQRSQESDHFLLYAMTLSAVSIRIYLGIIIGATGDPALALQIGSWLCWLPHFVPVYFLWRRIDRRTAEKLAKVRASVAKTLVQEEEARQADGHVSESESEFESARG
jgi:F0F1-type ATP synthase assembly protein I